MKPRIILPIAIVLVIGFVFFGGRSFDTASHEIQEGENRVYEVAFDGL